MSEETLLRRLRAECICGCGQPAKYGSQYASAACRARRYDQKNPRVSKATRGFLRRFLSQTPFELVEERPRRPRPPRVHIDVLGEDAELLDVLAKAWGVPRTAVVRALIRKEYNR